MVKAIWGERSDTILYISQLVWGVKEMPNEHFKLHPISIITGLTKKLQNWIFPLLIVFLVSLFEDGFTFWNFLFIFALIAIPLSVYLFLGLIKWLTFRYWFEDGEIRVKYGLFVKKKRFIPFERIQSFNYKEGVFHRIFGLVQVSIETAGGSEPEVVLTAISKKAAEQIELFTRSAKPQEHIEEGISKEEAKEIYKMSTKDLIILATTSNSVGIVISGIGAAFSQVSEYIPYDKIFDELHTMMKYGFLVIAATIFISFLFVWLISVIITFINYYDFTVVEKNNRLTITRGLLERKRITVPLNRVQAIQVIENPLRQWFGFATVEIESVGGNFEEDMKVILFPLILKKKMYDPLKQLFREFQFKVELIRPTKQGRPFFYRKDFIWLIPVIGACLYFFDSYGIFSIFLLLLVLLWRLWQYKTTGFAVNNNQLIIVYRMINRITFIAKRNKIQVVSSTQSYFQKRKNIASVRATVMASVGGASAKASHMEEFDVEKVISWFERK